jgi:hypothetical protein
VSAFLRWSIPGRADQTTRNDLLLSHVRFAAAHPFLLKEIALQAGLSEATVVRLLNKRGGVRRHTAQRVKQAILVHTEALARRESPTHCIAQ